MRKVLFVLLLFQAVALAQRADLPSAHPDEFIQGRGFIVVADRRVFALGAFLNAVGYDEQVEGKPMHPVRAKVRQMVAANLEKYPEKLRDWKRRYAAWRVPVFAYQDYVLSLTPDHPFLRIYPDDKLGYPVVGKRLHDFPDVLNDFWTSAQLDSVWEAVKPDYLAEIKKYSLERMEHELSFTWQYLRMPRQDTFVLVNVPNLLEKHYEAIGAAYGAYYYSVESPGASTHSLNVHEYLHHFINPLVNANSSKQQKKLDAYLKAGKSGPIAESYQDRVTFTYECLVRALDARIGMKLDPASRERIEGRIANETAKGLTMARPFYNLLSQFEDSNLPFDQFLPTLLEKLPPYSAER